MVLRIGDRLVTEIQLAIVSDPPQLLFDGVLIQDFQEI